MNASEQIPCPKCGHANPAGASYCELCLATFAPLAPQATDSAPQTASPNTLGPAERADFVAEIRRNRRRSRVLMLVFMLLLCALGFGVGFSHGMTVQSGLIGLGIAAVLSSIYMLLAYYRGGALIIAMAGAREVTEDETEFRQLFNVVEEMSIASGLPRPHVFVVEDPTPNAFATGRDPEHSAVTVTRGLLETLNRDELQGVIAHEMAHIASFDIRFMMLATALVGVIALLSDYFLRYGIFSRRSRSSKIDGRLAIIILIATIVLAILAPLFSMMLQMAISRKREYMADARSVAFTRNPNGLASALAKIAGKQGELFSANRATQHMYIVNPLKAASSGKSSLFNTHPPLEDRIQRLREMGAG